MSNIVFSTKHKQKQQSRSPWKPRSRLRREVQPLTPDEFEAAGQRTARVRKKRGAQLFTAAETGAAT
jgi:hypothetical protein